MSPQDILNTQHHGSRAVELLRQVQVHLQQSNNPRLAEQIDAMRIFEAVINLEVKSYG